MVEVHQEGFDRAGEVLDLFVGGAGRSRLFDVPLDSESQ
jgi:hypothetical protein